MTASGRPQRIRVLSLCPELEAGGAARQLEHFCRFADRDRLDLRVIYYVKPAHARTNLADLGVPVTFLDQQQLGPWHLLKALRREIKGWRPDVLDCRLPSGYRFGRLAALGAGVPVLVAEQRSCIRDAGPRRWFDLAANRWTDAWVGNSKAVAEHIHEHLHVPRERIHLIYNGVDVDHFRSAAGHESLAGLRAEGRRVVLNVGGLRPVKNQALFLRVADKLRQRFPELVFAFCGDGSERPALESLARDLDLTGLCRFLGYQEDVAPVLAAADLVLQTSDTEGLPNAVMEAMAAGVPTVSTDAGGTRELIEDRAGGLLAPVGDEAALVTRASEVLADAALARRLSEESLRRIIAQFSMQAMTAAYAELFEQLVARKRGLAAGDGGARP
jgi:glycosyltransferase involved in cell wall biosynthesis